MFILFALAYISFGCSEGEHPLAVRMLSGCQQAVNKLSRDFFFFAQTHFLELTKILTFTQKFPKIETDEIFRVAVRWLSGGCQEAVGWLSGKHNHNFEAKMKFGRWFRYHRKA